MARRPSLKSFAAPDVLRKIEPGNLLELFSPYRDYFSDRGFPLPESPVEELNYRQLAVVLLAADEETPPELMEALHVIGNTGIDERIDDLLRLAFLNGVDAGAADITPIDLAIRIWLKAPKVLEKIERDDLFQKKLKFEHFVSQAPGNAIPADELSSELAEMAAELGEWFEKNKRGPGCNIDRVVSGEEVRFLIDHGLPCKRERNRKGRESSPLYFRSEKTDIVVYDSAADELRVHASTLGEMRQYVAAFGKHLFGDANRFSFKAKYTLAPLQLRGRESLTCRNIEGLESIRLREIHWAWDGAFKHVETHRASDLFMAFAVRQVAIPKEPKIIKAVFEVKLTGLEKPRSATIKPPAAASFGRGEEAALIEQWLREQKFVVVGAAVRDEETDPVVVGV